MRPLEEDSQVLHINVQRFRGGLVFKAHRLCVSLNSRLESNKEEEQFLRFAPIMMWGAYKSFRG